MTWVRQAMIAIATSASGVAVWGTKQLTHSTGISYSWGTRGHWHHGRAWLYSIPRRVKHSGISGQFDQPFCWRHQNGRPVSRPTKHTTDVMLNLICSTLLCVQMHTGISPIYINTPNICVANTQQGIVYCKRSSNQYACENFCNASSTAYSGALPTNSGFFDW